MQASAGDSIHHDPEPVIMRAEFHPMVRWYLLLFVLFFLFTSVVGWLAIPFWVLGVGQWWSARYYRRLECELRERSLFFRRGVIIRSDTTIPLDRITDLTVKEGPLLRAMGLSRIRVETPGTSGQSGAGGITLIGIVGMPAFRDRVLAQRRHVRELDSAAAEGRTDPSRTTELLEEIRDSLRRIEKR